MNYNLRQASPSPGSPASPGNIPSQIPPGIDLASLLIPIGIIILLFALIKK